MKANPEHLIDLMFDNKRQYLIPVYQRNYDWKKDNCIELFNDIIKAYDKEKTHFLGTIVQVSQDDENGIKQYLIIDGQQRLTSVYLLLKALYDRADKPNDKEELRDYIFNTSSNKEYSISEKNKLKLKPIKSDNIQFIYLMNDQIEKMDKTSNIYSNYQLFTELIDNILSKGYSIKNIIKGLKYLEIVMISLKETSDGQGDDPQVVFERINSTGEDLTLADLIRNYVLMTDKNREELFEKYWLSMEEMLGKDNLVDYFMCYLTFKLPEQVAHKNSYQSFKNYVEITKISNEDILVDLQKYAKYYNVFIGNDDGEYSNEINTLLEYFRLLQQSTIYPFFFNIFNDYDEKIISQKELIEVLFFFLNYTLRRLVVGVPSNSLRGLYKSLYRRIFINNEKDNYVDKVYNFMTSLNSTKDSVPNDTNFKNNLLFGNMYKNTKLCKLLLSILENNYDFKKENVKIDSKISIEHIMPQNKNEQWENEIGSDYFSVHEKYLHTLGNLTLTGYNSELGDKSFNEKKKMLINNSKFVHLNKDVIDKKNWNAKSISLRGERLSSEIVNKFSLPKKMVERKNENKELMKHTTMDGNDYTSTKPISFILLGDSKNVSSYSELLSETVNLLYEIDARTLKRLAEKNYKMPNATRVYITFDKSILRRSIEIFNTGIFIEGNLSANNIVSFIHHLLNEYDILDEDYIFYVTDIYHYNNI